jgi:hypothetical protein
VLPLPEAIIAVLGCFAPLFSQPVWRHVRVLVVGALLCQGARTVTAVLRVMGLKGEKRFGKYHRVLSRARWSGLMGARMLLGLLVALLPAGWPILMGIDETIERRQGRKIQAKGVYREAVRSTEKHVIKCLGLKWVSMMLLVPLPWSSRPWALPFLTVLAPSRAANEKASTHHGRLGRAPGSACQPLVGSPLGIDRRWRVCLCALCSDLSTPRGDAGGSAALGRRPV